jgi:hypothetical protein
MSSRLAHIPVAALAPGTHKYVLVECSLGGEKLTIVRSADREYHKGVKQETEAQLRKDARNAGITFSCPGGGRITHDPATQRAFVYGFSNAYGPGDHALACQLIIAGLGYPAANVTWSSDGY